MRHPLTQRGAHGPPGPPGPPGMVCVAARPALCAACRRGHKYCASHFLSVSRLFALFEPPSL